MDFLGSLLPSDLRRPGSNALRYRVGLPIIIGSAVASAVSAVIYNDGHNPLAVTMGMSMWPTLPQFSVVWIDKRKHLMNNECTSKCGTHVNSRNMDEYTKYSEEHSNIKQKQKIVYAELGDLVAFARPDKPQRLVIKRLVALEGERVPKDVTLKSYTEPSLVLVPSGHAWVQGDNLFASEDSRQFGAIPVCAFHGRVTYVLWPPSHFGRVERTLDFRGFY